MLDIPDGLGYGAKSPELRESSREEPLRTKAEKALSPFSNNKVSSRTGGIAQSYLSLK